MQHDAEKACLAKLGSYFQGVRRDYVDALPIAPYAAILEIGCAEGGTGALALESGKCARYVGNNQCNTIIVTGQARITRRVTPESTLCRSISAAA